MKKIAALIPSTLLFVFCGFAQDSVLFKMHYLQNHLYKQTVKQKTHTEINYSGRDELMQTLKERGIQNPTKTDQETSFKAAVTTGKLNDNDIMPIEMSFVEPVYSNSAVIIPANTKVLGSVSHYGIPQFDSVVADGMDEEFKKGFMVGMQSVLSQIKLPEKKMAKGDEFVQKTPITIPLGLVTVKMDVTTTYKLIDFNDSEAYFDLLTVSTISMDADEKVAATGGGEGSGKFVYNRLKDFPSLFNLSSTMDITTEVSPMKIHLVLNNESEYNYEITSKD